jgi:23S rRNA (guanine745-N1)-methyltransferase
MIRCPICLEPLHQDKPKRCYACINRHSFDVAKEGYINLLRNQPDAGDNKQMIQARHAMMNTNLFRPLMNRLVELLTPYQLTSLLDAGCGEGTYLRTIASKIT